VLGRSATKKNYTNHILPNTGNVSVTEVNRLVSGQIFIQACQYTACRSALSPEEVNKTCCDFKILLKADF
jgi:hypothetical protein